MIKSLYFSIRAASLFLVGFSLSSEFSVAGISTGAEIAVRYPETLNSASPTVLGNGSLGCLFESAEVSKTFFDATLVGEHWLIHEQTADATPLPALRVPFCRFTLELKSESSPGIEKGRLTSDSIYRLWDNRLTANPSTDGIAAATLTVSPTRDLVIGRLDFQAPCDTTLEVRILFEGKDFGSPPLAQSHRIAPGAMALTQNLPFGESYGMGVVLDGSGEVESATTEGGVLLSLLGSDRLTFALLVVHPEEGFRLEERVVEELRALTSQDWNTGLEKDREWWSGFWDRSILDSSGSTDERAVRYEKLWVALRHGFATHARGSFPPADSGYWPSPVGGRVWHPLLWETFRGWILTGNESDIGWLSYPLSFPSEESSNGSEGSAPPLLPLESGPDGVAAPDTSGLIERFADLVPANSERMNSVLGREFSAFPFLVDCLAKVGINRKGTDELFPFLKANALLAEREFERSGKDTSEAPHFIVAVEAAKRQARRFGVDSRSQSRWGKILESYGLNDSATPALENRIQENLFSQPGESAIESLLDLSLTPDGLVRDSEGDPSMVLSGIALSRLADCLFSEREGVLQVLPDIPLDGSWSLEAKNVSVPGGFTLRTITMRKGLIDSFLLRSNEGGICRLRTPPGWSSARILNIGSPQSPVEVEGKEVFEFETQAGDEFLIGPLW